MSGDGTSLGEARILRQSDKAIMVELVEVGEEIWVPKSVIHDDSEVYGDDVGPDGLSGDLVVKQWWAEKNGHT